VALPPFQFITAIPPQYLTPVCGGIGQIGIRRYGNVAWFGARTPPHNIEHHRTIVRQPRPTWTLRFRHKRNAAFLALSERTAKVWRRCAVGRHSSSHRRHMDKVRPTPPFRPPPIITAKVRLTKRPASAASYGPPSALHALSWPPGRRRLLSSTQPKATTCPGARWCCRHNSRRHRGRNVQSPICQIT
jgi:hypothetical protein